jgi:hypothetical protein
MLIEQPISTPAIFTLAGLEAAETTVIERTEQEARVRDGAQVAANHWETPDWHGHARGDQSSDRACIMRDVETSFDTEFRWLTLPILNDNTRLALVADAKEGRMIARGYEKTGPATTTLDMTWHPSA